MSFNDIVTEGTTFEEILGYEQDFDINIEIEQLYKALNLIPEKEKQILVHYFGLYGVMPMTQMDLVEKFGLSQASICRYIRKGIERIQKIMCVEETNL